MKAYKKVSIASDVKKYSPKPIIELSEEQIGRIKLMDRYYWAL